MTTTPFPVLGDAQYITYIGPVVHRGANSSAHLAEIRYPVQMAPVQSVLKLLAPDGLAACNEAIAWLFLRAAGVGAPRHAAILTLTEARAVQILGRRRVPPGLVEDGHVLAWSAQQLEFPSIRAAFAGTEGDARWLRLLRTVQGAAIAAFDETLLNIDRNTGNVLFVSDTACIAVDHEYSFGMQNWRTSAPLHLTQDGDSLRTLKAAVAAGRMDGHSYRKVCNAMVLSGQNHGSALQACQGAIAELLTRVYPKQAPTLAARVLSFVAVRTAQHWIETRLGVV